MTDSINGADSLSSDRFKPHPEVIDTIIDADQGALIHSGSLLTFALNRTGVVIWNALKEGLGPAEMGARLQETFEIAPDDARRSAERFIRDLLALGLIVCEPG